MGSAWPSLLLVSAAVWAAGGLLYHAGRAARARRVTFAGPRGNPAAGALYMFTTAMRPSHKESVSRHPGAFVLGLVLHLAALGALGGLAAILLEPSWSSRLRIPLVAVALTGCAAAATMLVRRVANPVVRILSVPDDFLAIGLAVAFLAMLALASSGLVPVAAAAVAASVLLFYVPLGKLRHMVFFFLARADLGHRLGYRGVLPPARAAEPARRRA